MKKNLSELEKKINIIFKNKDLLKQALIHRSYLNENPNFSLGHNERLEFLGDAVLELVVTEFLYILYPNKPEGELTNLRASLVNSQMLSELAFELDLDEYIFLSRGEAQENSKGKARRYILANAVEALIGAIYLDQDYKKTKKFIEKYFLVKLPEILIQKTYIDPKSKFQEIAQEKEKVTPFYKVLKETGPDHAKHFQIGVYLEEELIAKGEGESKQEAQVSAAKEALKLKKWEY
ncbi:ribonuclease III [Candidatus Kuenenbacteria bacterium HGW-Kuenenbacteria-1]|uniref:Ribonuclease 3 n=1 Tax=Candidatus Kuenenbacteria bacterium HGW-Kuenenbacteria-1 TaxID=2013812 RepID=A0A2N1UP84_9BACT|nr:MAG: ribonuclease III [Candidatus Kuenenbacteria bacterium HGW-Kuenenbacteria-1]